MVTTKTPLEGLIHLDVNATDKAGKFISGLTVKDFTVLDNGLPQKIVSFRLSNEEPKDGIALDEEELTDVILVLDEVNPSSEQVGLARDETIQFLRQNGGKLARPVSIYWFTPTGLYASAFPTTDGNALANEVAHHHVARTVWEMPPKTSLGFSISGTRHALWDKALRTVYTAAIDYDGKPGRKLLVWIGIGWPSNSTLTGRFLDEMGGKDPAFSSLVELRTRINKARMVLYQVTPWDDPESSHFVYQNHLAGIRSSSEMNDPASDFALPVVALQSGGQVLDSPRSIVRGIDHCIQEASSFYSLSFNPPNAAAPDEFHDVKVQISEPAVTARTNSGYYDQPIFYDQPRVPARRLTIQQLERLLDTADNEHDSELAKTLRDLELTERLSSQRLALWKNRLHGNRSKEALTALADGSVFLDLPQDEVLSDPAPTHQELVEMLSKTVKYLDETIPKLPDLSATRSMIEYKQPSPGTSDSWKTALADQSLYKGATATATLRYRNGHEVHDAQREKSNQAAKGKFLDFIGVFGPIDHSVLIDATHDNGKLTWIRWEKGEHGREAVISYSVLPGNSSYDVDHCCLRGEKHFEASPEYRGELNVDSTTGAILRLTMQSTPGWILEPNLHPVLPVEATGMMVEYGPVEIGGRPYICPVRSVIYVRTRSMKQLTFWGQSFEVYSPYETQLNDIAYTDYRKFGSEFRILPGFEVVPGATSDEAGKGQPSVTKQPNP